jgi:hypothetical protein
MIVLDFLCFLLELLAAFYLKYYVGLPAIKAYICGAGVVISFLSSPFFCWIGVSKTIFDLAKQFLFDCW